MEIYRNRLVDGSQITVSMGDLFFNYIRQNAYVCTINDFRADHERIHYRSPEYMASLRTKEKGA